MTNVENGSFVSFDYKGTLDNGKVFDTSANRQPLEFKMGAGHVIKGLEENLLGMALNEKKTFTVSPENGFGERNEELNQSFSKSELPPDSDPKPGQIIGVETQEGHQIPATITEVHDDTFSVDMNHPLAGRSLTFDVEIVGISDKPTQEHNACPTDEKCDCSSGQCPSDKSN